MSLKHHTDKMKTSSRLSLCLPWVKRRYNTGEQAVIRWRIGRGNAKISVHVICAGLDFTHNAREAANKMDRLVVSVRPVS